jgi:hypothetical protein
MHLKKLIQKTAFLPKKVPKNRLFCNNFFGSILSLRQVFIFYIYVKRRIFYIRDDLFWEKKKLLTPT